jgi:hypothetical protein
MGEFSIHQVREKQIGINASIYGMVGFEIMG